MYGPKPRPAIERFVSKVQQDGDCWNWTGAAARGYGQLNVNGMAVQAHRWSYEFHVGPIPKGLVLDHLCRNTRCVNPYHLDPVPLRVNLDRGNHRYDKNRAERLGYGTCV